MRKALHQEPDGALILCDCRVVDGLGGTAAEGEVWVASGRIVAPDSVRAARRQPLGGRVVAPGLIDAHVHLCFDSSPDPLGSFCSMKIELLERTMRENAALTLRAGVTLVRDMGAPTAVVLALRDAIASGTASGPQVLASGTPITIPGGHLHEMGGGVRGVAAIRGAARALAQAGVDMVKAIATGGGSSPQTDPHACQFTQEEFSALVAEARSNGLPVACHAHADAGIRQAVAAGASTIEHGSYASEASLRAMAERSMTLVPTLAPAIAALARSAFPVGRRAAIRERLESRREAVRLAVRHGLRVVAGTDAGTAFTPHGGLAAEIVALVECGLPPWLALAAAGREAAVALGVPDAGTLTPGSRADLIVLEGDPHSDLRHLIRPYAVMQAGRWVSTPKNAGPGSPG